MDAMKPTWWTSDHWATPPDLMSILVGEFGAFDLDPCCRPETAKAATYFTETDDGLAQRWSGQVFLNPPYSAPALGAPAGWKDEGKECGYLAVRDEQTTVGPAMTSAWELEPHEVEAVTKGAPLYLTVCGVVHPPVAIKVGRPPED